MRRQSGKEERKHGALSTEIKAWGGGGSWKEGKETFGFTSIETIKGLLGTVKLGGQEFYILHLLVILSPPE